MEYQRVGVHQLHDAGGIHAEQVGGHRGVQGKHHGITGLSFTDGGLPVRQLHHAGLAGLIVADRLEGHAGNTGCQRP